MKRSRRLVLIGAAVIGGGLAVGVGWVERRLGQVRAYRLPESDGERAFGAWLTIDRQGIVHVAVPHQEMGQGVFGTIPMIVAEELDCDPANVRARPAPLAAVYANPVVVIDGLPLPVDGRGPIARTTRWTADHLLRAAGIQITGGSTSMRNVFVPARQAGASARAMLVAAAASRLGVPASALSVDAGRIRHVDSGRVVGFGELVDAAAAIEPPEAPMKSSKDFRLLGKPQPRPDVPSKVDGRAQFAIDLRLDDMLHAAIQHGPSIGATLVKAELAPPLPGVVALVTDEAFVAVIAESHWQAKMALAQVRAEWDERAGASISTEAVFRAFAQAIDRGDGYEFESDGDADRLLARDDARLAAEYRVPFLAHATMEPMNCTVRLSSGGCEVWVGNQLPTIVRWAAAKAAGIDVDRVQVHTPMLGGGFGRRLEVDTVREAVRIARKAPAGRAVQTIWSREEDIRCDVFRPAVLARMAASVDAEGRIRAWRHSMAGPSVSRQYLGRLHPGAVTDLPDRTCAEGAIDLPYEFGARRIVHARVDAGVPVGYWRSVGHSYNAFFVESFIDECAARAKQDPYRFRRRLLADRRESPLARRCLAVLDAVAGAANWGVALAPRGGVRTGRGLALAVSFRSIVAQIAEVEVSAKGRIRVTRVTAAVDCGFAIDPAIVRAQVSGAILFGLTAALHGRIDIEAGRVRQSNFHDYPLIGLAEAPSIQVEIVPSEGELGGIGEVGTPGVAPAVANAVFAATGTRLRELPLKLAG